LSDRSNDLPSPRGGLESLRSSRDRENGLSPREDDPKDLSFDLPKDFPPRGDFEKSASLSRENFEGRDGFESSLSSRERENGFSPREEDPKDLSFDLPKDFPPRGDFEKSASLSREKFEGRDGFESSLSSRERENGFSPREDDPKDLSFDLPNELPPRGGFESSRSSRERENGFLFRESDEPDLLRLEGPPERPGGFLRPRPPASDESRLRIGFF
jgi:hypothetical protein